MNLPDGYFLQGKKYRLTHTIGQGGFGITYLGVWNTEVKGGLGAMKTTVPVCIKEYFFKDYCYRDKNSFAIKVHSITGEKLFGKFKEKLIAEANILSAVHHPNIVSVLEVFEENDTAYIVMEYIKGYSLKYLLDKNGVLPEYKVIKYTHQIGNALSFVHEKSIVHLDIKPGNILIDQQDNARLIDFGVSKRYDIEEQETSTTTLTLSKGFAAIEQYDDEGMLNFSPAPDIYSLGATMYNLLTGVIPIESILRATKQMLPPSAYNSNITPKTEKAILKAMEIKPKDRYRKVNELLVAIDTPTYEFTENTYTETNRIEDDESTEVFNNPKFGLSDDEEDKTIFNTSEHANPRKKTKSRHKTRRRLLLTASILLAAFVGYGIFSYFSEITSSQGTQSGIIFPDDVLTTRSDTPIVNQTDSLESAQSGQTGSSAESEPPTQQVTVQTPVTNPPSQGNNTSQANGSQTPTTPPVSQILADNNPASTQGSSENEANTPILTKADYEGLIALGLSKRATGDLIGAKEVFSTALDQAKQLGISLSEVNEYIEECNKGITEQNKEAISAQYKIIVDDWYGGPLKIVEDRKTGKIGAINSLGETVIPCIYVQQTRTGDGTNRVFYLDDKKGVVYDNTGKEVGLL